jgi:hypothetical protein
VVDGVEDLITEVVAKGYAFAVDLFVAAAGEIDPFETTGPAFFGFQYRLDVTLPSALTIRPLPGISSMTSFSPTLNTVRMADLSEAATTTSSLT